MMLNRRAEPVGWWPDEFSYAGGRIISSRALMLIIFRRFFIDILRH